MPFFYAVTLFVSAFLLFLVQPMVGKMTLPLMGGTPLVWNTCMVFFQAMLLGGYLYAHATTTYFDSRRQTLIHAGLMLMTVITMGIVAAVAGKPINVSESLSPQGVAFPAPKMFLVLVLGVGLPFLTVASSAPLLQKWYANTGHRGAKDPYFLYAASNLGSVLALIAYPVLIEWILQLGVVKQSWIWFGGYFVLLVLIAGCAAMVWRSSSAVRFGETRFEARPLSAAPSPGWPRRLRWLLLAFVPSSLMLGVTTYIATDIASFPLLWIIPLGLYLITFIIAFSRIPEGVHSVLSLATPVMVLLLLFVLISGIQLNVFIKFALHLAAFFMVSLSCHCDLARTRPPAARLTEFYLIISIGGVLGGLFNAMIAPEIFQDVYEYRITLCAACLALPALREPKYGAMNFAIDILAVAGIAALASVLVGQFFLKPGEVWADYSGVAWWRRVANDLSDWMSNRVGRGVDPENLFKVFVYGIPALVCYVFVERPLRFGLCVATLLLVAHFSGSNLRLLFQARSPFGVLRVYSEFARHPHETAAGVEYQSDEYHELVHGTTIHGWQRVNPPSTEPLTYYHQAGPIGEIFATVPILKTKPNIAVIGLGTGSMAAYCQEGQQITFFEIDSLVRRIAEEPGLIRDRPNLRMFTFLKSCRGRYDIVMGDARVKMQRLPPEVTYGIIVVDAFSSDSIPVHLLTREALRQYVSRLDRGGVVVLHISNHYLDLQPVVRKLAADAGLQIRICSDRENHLIDKSASNWVILAQTNADLGALSGLVEFPMRQLQDNGYWDFVDQTFSKNDLGKIGAIGGGILPSNSRERWPVMTAEPHDPLWTDDFSNLLRIIEWR